MQDKIVKIVTWTICGILDTLTITFLMLNFFKVISWPYEAILSPLITKVVLQAFFLFLKGVQSTNVTLDGGDKDGKVKKDDNNTQS